MGAAPAPRPPHLALILRGGGEEPRAVLLADVDDLEGEDVVGRRLLSRPHHPESSTSGHRLLPAHRDRMRTDRPLDRPWPPAPRPQEHGHPPPAPMLGAWVLAAEGSMWARAGGERQCQSRRASRKRWCRAPSQGHATLAAPRSETLLGCLGPRLTPGLPAGDPHRARVSLGPTPVPRQRAPEHFRKVAVAGPAAETWGSGNDHACPGHAVRLGTQAGALRGPGPYPGARRHTHQAPGGMSGEKKRPSSSCHYDTERQTERRALRESEFLAISWPTWPSPLTFWSLSYFIWETGTATSSLIIIQNCCED